MAYRIYKATIRNGEPFIETVIGRQEEDNILIADGIYSRDIGSVDETWGVMFRGSAYSTTINGALLRLANNFSETIIDKQTELSRLIDISNAIDNALRAA